ncbi:MAG TPA: outer membrane beta-barrel protein [Gammaproteobacteria bacterium]|nr:outer membrane beta-barrel protein [Gammaproteobacteria bacterium]
MRKKAIALALASAAICAAPLAQAATAASSEDGFFLTAKVGTTAWSLNDQYSDNQKATAYGAQGGYRWSINDANAIGFDVGYVDFGSIDDAGGGMFATLSGSAITAGVNYQLRFGNAWYLEARTGYMKLTLESSITLPGVSIQIGPISTDLGLGFNYSSDEYDGVYLGVGVGRWLTPSFGLSVNYDYHRADDINGDSLNLPLFSVAAEFLF